MKIFWHKLANESKIAMDLLPQFRMDESFLNQTVPQFFNYSNVSETNLLAHDDILFKEYPPALLIFASISCVIFIILGVPGNLITIIALARCKKVRNATAVFIINLSLSDLLFCCFNLPLQASTFYHRQWIHGPLLCRLFPLLRYGLLAVSLFTILAITINRYIMIGHPRIYPRIYRRKFLAVMVALTWIGAFGALIPTWRGTWGKFGLDRTIGSCSILHVNNVSPKEFLFIMAFALPCISIVVCYARIFYIVRKTAMKINEPSTNNKIVGSIKMTHNHATYNNNNNNGQYKNSILMPPGSNQHKELKEIQHQNLDQEKSNEGHRLSFADEQDEMKLSRNNSQRSSRTKKLLKRTQEEELKFIDTSIESDLPPTLSSLQRKLLNTQSPIHESNPTSPLTVTVTNEQERVGSISKVVENTKNGHDNYVDSAVEESIISQDNPVCNAHNDHQNEHQANHMLNVQMEPSSSSGIELPYDHESPEKSIKNSLVSTHKVKKRKLKNCSNNVTDVNRKKSTANTSGASIMYVGRMTPKDRRLLKMILVIFISFLICYLPITLTKLNKKFSRVYFLNVMGYLLVYLTTCINPIIYVVMSSEYRQAYWNLLMCRINNGNGSAAKVNNRRA